ncbi:hypothetical protein [Synechococcus sp. RSCCF101]|uniref:hypothetical protein n=1 Tax=Synechococcus sp. RSCCF101 TaxID=2511069 RepID=UPI00351A5B7A
MADLPRGYTVLAWLGLAANLLAFPAVALDLATDAHLKVLNLVMACSVAWPDAVVGVVACAALLARRRWGIVVAIVALSLALAGSLPYVIVRLVLVPDQRLPLALGASAFWLLNLLALIYWCRPVHRRRLAVYRV